MEIQNSRSAPTPKRLLVIRRNRMGDMICTLPLLHALRRACPQAHLTVACDREGAPIAQACPAVDQVHVLARGWIGLAANALRLRGYDAVIAVKGGFDKRLGMLARLTDAPVRIGYHHATGQRPSKLYTHPFPLPAYNEHQLDTCLRLGEPFGVTATAPDFTLRLPEEATAFADELLRRHRQPEHRLVAVINTSSNRPSLLSDKQLATLIGRLAGELGALVALSSLPDEKSRRQAHHLLQLAKTPHAFVLETPSPLHLCAVLARSGLVITPEGGVGHLAVSTGTPAVILWSEGPFDKWRTRADNHRFVHLASPHRPSLNEIWATVLETVNATPETRSGQP